MLYDARLALWWAGKDDWNKAHQIVVNGEGLTAHEYTLPVFGIGRHAPGNLRSCDGMGNYRRDAVGLQARLIELRAALP